MPEEMSGSHQESYMGSSSSTKRFAAIALVLFAALSPLYISRKHVVEDEGDDRGGSMVVWLQLLLIFLVLIINFTCFLDGRFMRFDAYWIHRMVGSSCGIISLLLLLGLILRFKSSLSS